MKNKLRKRVSAGLMISVLAVMAALLAVLAAKPHLRFTAGEYLGLNTRKVTVAKISPELEEVSVGALRGDSRVMFDQSLMLVNSKYPLKDGDEPELAEYKKTGVIMNACAAESYSELSAAVREKTDSKLLVMSSVRDAQEQKELYGRDSSTAAAPGTSEHQTGLCCDMHNLGGADVSFANKEAYTWLIENCYKFGFILRFPEDKVEITGYSFEPWHYRFVGRYHATRMHNLGMCLEEYTDYLANING